jgi:hypothetical protein
LEHLIRTLLGLLLRALLLAMGLVFVASLLIVAGVLFTLWLLRALWLRLTGRPVAPWAFKFNPRAQWGRFHAATATRTDHAAKPQHAKEAIADITDVVPRESKPDAER